MDGTAFLTPNRSNKLNPNCINYGPNLTWLEWGLPDELWQGPLIRSIACKMRGLLVGLINNERQINGPFTFTLWRLKALQSYITGRMFSQLQLYGARLSLPLISAVLSILLLSMIFELIDPSLTLIIWVNLKKKSSMVKMLLNFKTIKSRGKITWWPWGCCFGFRWLLSLIKMYLSRPYKLSNMMSAPSP